MNGQSYDFRALNDDRTFLGFFRIIVEDRANRTARFVLYALRNVQQDAYYRRLNRVNTPLQGRRELSITPERDVSPSRGHSSR